MTAKPLTTEQIAAALKSGPSVAECDALHSAIDARREAVRARLAEISPGPTRDGSSDPEELRAALETSPSRFVELNYERDELIVEMDMLERLGFRVNEARETAYTEAAKREIPSAMKRIPGKAQKVRDAMRSLDAAIEELRAEYDIVAEFPRIGACPFSDDQLADLLELRDAVWAIRTISPPNSVGGAPTADHVMPSVPSIRTPGTDPRADWPRSWPLLWSVSSHGITMRRGPLPAEPPAPAAGGSTGAVRRALQFAAGIFE